MSHYTWSHARAHESDYYFNDPRVDYGNSYYNRRNVFVMLGNWDSPFGRNRAIGGNLSGWVDQVISGLTLNGTWTAETGLPFTPSYSLCTQDQDIDGQGGSLCRPNAVVPGADFGLHAGSFNPITHKVRYFNALPTLTRSRPGRRTLCTSFARPFRKYSKGCPLGPASHQRRSLAREEVHVS